ncbi:Spy/CpxP family protein refolding chaperone [Saccharicrinis fermentans]|uniref:Periplasmic heavy metal sensor n=1 Tax=Saccharicrinis fermentans DSM 9555 = JCM 21142 TaxID=869213 RepID=W7YID2_9BACT|nr:Spy/CpxP family protein refolding chaperone [Saccharicrinis fermentans]GAF02309.1 hypothetical protein JCM21142_3943 [Saccharicrinis fermentans DSM 9555 = JCM 21142]
MDKKHYIIIIAFLVVLNIFSWRIWWDSPTPKSNNDKEQVGNGSGRRGGKDSKNFFAEKLKLSPAQKIEFAKLKASYSVNVEAVKDSMNIVRKLLLSTITDTSHNASSELLFKDMASYKLQMEQLTMQYFVNMRSLCNEKQKRMFDELMTRIMDPSARHKERGKFRNRKRGEGTEHPQKN